MLGYKNLGNVIEVYLDGKYKGYSVLAIYIPMRGLCSKEEITGESEEEYIVSLWLRATNIDDGLPVDIQKISNEPIIATKSTIKKRLSKFIGQMCDDGYMQEYVDRYEYYCDCFTYGNDYYENVEEKDFKID